MAINTPKPEEIFVKLRPVEVLMGQGMHAEYGSYKARLFRTLFCKHIEDFRHIAVAQTCVNSSLHAR